MEWRRRRGRREKETQKKRISSRQRFCSHVFSEVQGRSKEICSVLHSIVFPVFPRAKAEAEARFSSASAELDLRRSFSSRLDTQRDVNDRIHETMMCYAIRRLVSENRN